MGRGSSKGKGGGMNPADIVSTSDMLSNSAKFPKEANDVMNVAQELEEMYGDSGVIFQFQTAELKGSSKNTVMAYYDGKNIAINENYMDTAKMTAAYDNCVKSGYHPGRGDRTAMEATAAHEFGHALSDAAAKKMGLPNLDQASTRILQEARKQTSHRGINQMASKISGYAQQSHAEAVAEAFADVFCNGNKAKAESQAIVNVLNGYVRK